MATRSCIGVKCGNKIVAIYAHWDGYVSHMGRHLDEYYNGLSEAIALIAKGELVSIKPTIEESEFYNEPLGASNFQEFGSIKEFTEHYLECWCEFAYLYFTDTETWKVCDLREDTSVFRSLSQAVCLQAVKASILV